MPKRSRIRRASTRRADRATSARLGSNATRTPPVGAQVEVDFVVYGPRGFWAIEVKRGADISPKDLKGLQVFCKEYPEATPLFFYLGKEHRKVKGIDCVPVSSFLSQIYSDQSLINLI